MPNVYATTVIPENLQWWGIGRELTAGTVVSPSLSIPLDKGLPEDKPTILTDKALRGYMGVKYNDIVGTEIADFPLSGPVYLDTIGYLLHNIYGDYQASGSTPASSTTLSAQANAGATSVTLTLGTGWTSYTGPAQIGTTGTAPYEVVNVQSVSGTTVTLSAATPLRMTHASGAAISQVAAPFTHSFAILNGGGAFGLPTTGQGPTHTLTYANQLSTNLSRQYAYYRVSGIDFKMTPEQLFQHDTKGMSIVGVDAASLQTNTQSGVVAVPDWEFKVGIGGPASGGTLVNNVIDASFSIDRSIKDHYGMNGQQAPYVIGQLGLDITGKLSILAKDESPLLALLNGTQQQLQISMTQGAGASTLSCTFNCQLAQYTAVPISAPDFLCWDVSFDGLMNSTDKGASGGLGPGTVQIVNAVPTY